MDSPRGRPAIVWSPAYEVDIGPHVFPTAKYRLVRERLLAERCVREEDFIEPRPATWEEVGRVHGSGYLAKIVRGELSPGEIRLLELPFSAALRDAALLSAGGTILSARRALADGISVHLGGGFHHAFADHGEGFCLINDVAVAARAMQAEGGIERAAVVDLDVHHGNGTAAIFADDPAVFTFSMHQEWNYPALKPPSDLDVGLHDGIGDAAYLSLLARHLPEILDGHRPQLVIFLAGGDPYREDQLGGLALTIEGLRQRDHAVFRACRERGIAVAAVLAGGYALRREDTVAIHRNTVVEALGTGNAP